MIYHNKEIVDFERLHGGVGHTTIYKHFVEGDVGRMKMVANVKLERGASIGYHQHTKDSEIYHIINGTAEFIDHDKSVAIVSVGDCCVIEKGQSHGIINIGDDILEFIAILF
jgi:mannose-6-phosphate isomerase-like protein (cupin superfamily)